MQNIYKKKLRNIFLQFVLKVKFPRGIFVKLYTKLVVFSNFPHILQKHYYLYGIEDTFDSFRLNLTRRQKNKTNKQKYTYLCYMLTNKKKTHKSTVSLYHITFNTI